MIKKGLKLLIIDSEVFRRHVIYGKSDADVLHTLLSHVSAQTP